jgi:hypothetical protein
LHDDLLSRKSTPNALVVNVYNQYKKYLKAKSSHTTNDRHYCAGYAADRYRPVVLVSCGSFNPPTFMHLRMLELARHALMDAGEDVLGAYLSPVNDAYWKRSLAPGVHRVRMCQLAAATSGKKVLLRVLAVLFITLRLFLVCPHSTETARIQKATALV